MRIALDYDGTYTRDPDLWQTFVWSCIKANHDIRIVTSRRDDMLVLQVQCPVIYTDLQPKGVHCVAKDWIPDVWIDDHPERIFR